MVHRLLVLLASSAALAPLVAAYDEIGFAQAVGDVSKGCFGLQSTFVKTGDKVVFDLGTGTYDAAKKSATLTYAEEGRTEGRVEAKDGKLTYTVVSNGTTCAYDLEVMAGSFLGVQGTGKVDSAGVVSISFDQARSQANAACKQTADANLAFITVGNFAAAGGRVGSYDPVAKKALFVSGFDNIFAVTAAADGKALEANLQTNTGATKCGYNLKVVEGKVFDVTA